jgi:hypothetical protein
MKKMKKILFYIVSLTLLNVPSYAIGWQGTLDEPHPTDFLVPLQRIFNLFLMLAGIVLAGVIVYGAIKLSMSFGDPRKLQGARQTLTYAVFGFGIILMFFAGVFFLLTALGVDVSFANPNDIFVQMREGIQTFLDDARVYN